MIRSVIIKQHLVWLLIRAGGEICLETNLGLFKYNKRMPWAQFIKNKKYIFYVDLFS